MSLIEEYSDGPSAPGVDAHQLARVVAELARRRHEALRLYEPLPEQARFHASLARERLVVGSNRSGKTLTAAAEVARALTGQDPSGKYPLRDGRCLVLGSTLKHVGRVMWPKLYRPGAFRMIRDPATNDWRAFHPWETQDIANARHSRRAAPLLPHRLIDSIAWENKKENIPSQVRLKNGWEIWFFSSEGKPGQGFDIDLAWIDEECVERTWYTELLARLLDRAGRVFWSATAQLATEQFYDLHERAERAREEGGETPAVEEFTLLLADNPHIGTEEKKTFADQLADDPEAVRVRIEGGYAIEGHKVYPEFSMRVHGIDPFLIPPDWTRYFAVDPGTQVCAVIFLAVPPPSAAPEHADQVFLYDELYIQRCSAQIFGEQVARKVGHQQFELFLIDYQSAKTQEMGSGKTVQEQYSLALAAQRITSAKTGNNFLWGSYDVAGGIESVRNWLNIRSNGLPTLRVFRGRLPHFEKEIDRYHYRRDQEGHPTDKPYNRRDHLLWGLRALAAYGPKWVPAVTRPPPAEGAYRAYLAKKKQRQAAKGGEPFVHLGPPQ